MNILYLCGSYGLDLDKMLGPKTHVQAILRGLTNAEHKVTLLAVQETDILNDYSEFEHYVIKHKYIRLFLHKIIPYTGFLDSIRVFWKIFLLNRNAKIDIIHERYTGLSWGGIISSKLLGIPLVVQMVGPGIEEKKIQGNPVDGIKKWILIQHQKVLLKNQSALILVSKKIVDFVYTSRGWKIPKYYVIPNGADEKTNADISRANDIKSRFNTWDYKVFIYTGSLYKWYEVINIVKAFRIVLKKIPNIKLIMIGNGDAINEIKTYISKYNLENNIIIISAIPHNEISNYILISDICLVYFPEILNYTGNTTKIFEYMAIGKPIISTPNMNDIIQHGINGLFSQSYSPKDYANLMESAIINYEKVKEIGLNAKQDFLNKYTWNIYISTLVRIYKNILENK